MVSVFESVREKRTAKNCRTVFFLRLVKSLKNLQMIGFLIT